MQEQRTIINFDEHITSHPWESYRGGMNVILKLFKLGLHDSDVPAICDYLTLHPKISEVNLMANYLTDEGAILLSHIKTIQILRVAFNKELGPKGLLALIYNSQLHQLYAGATALNELPTEATHALTPFSKFVYQKAYGLSLPLLSLQQLSLFAVKQYTSTEKEVRNKKTEERSVAENVFCELHDVTVRMSSKPVFVTLQREDGYAVLDSYRRVSVDKTHVSASAPPVSMNPC